MTKIENSHHMTAVIARKLCAENAADLHDSTLEKLLAPCVSGPKLVEFAKANKIFLCAEFMKIWANEHAPKYLWDMADYLATQGWIFRSSVSQVEWTQAGCDAWRAAFSAEFPEAQKLWGE